MLGIGGSWRGGLQADGGGKVVVVMVLGQNSWSWPGAVSRQAS